MQQRSENDILTQTLTVMLGAKEYTVKSLTIMKAIEWRKKVWASVETMIGRSGALATIEQLKAAIQESPMEMISIVASYLGMTNDELVATEATEQQVTLAFASIMGIAFSPFLNQQAVMDRLRSGKIFQPSAPPTN